MSIEGCIWHFREQQIGLIEYHGYMTSLQVFYFRIHSYIQQVFFTLYYTTFWFKNSENGLHNLSRGLGS